MNQHQSINIPASLTGYINHIAVMRSDVNANFENSFSIFADGCPGIIFQQSASGMFLDENNKKLSSLFLYGQTVKPILLNTDRQCEMIVLILKPHVLKQLFGFNAKEVTDNCLDLKLVPSSSRLNLTEQLCNADTTEAQAAILINFLTTLIQKNNTEPDNGLQYAANKIMGGKGSTSLKYLQTKLNVSERTFERKFEQHVGVSAKMLSTIAQFQASLLQLKNNQYSKLSDIAYDNGYSDQSHFIRSFKKFTGFSPFQYQNQPGIIVDSAAELMQ
jgi:AraC-like DNA-binding protein